MCNDIFVRFQISIKAAGGNGLAVTEVLLLDASIDNFHTFNYKQEADWTIGLCACCLEVPAVSN